MAMTIKAQTTVPEPITVGVPEVDSANALLWSVKEPGYSGVVLASGLADNAYGAVAALSRAVEETLIFYLSKLGTDQEVAFPISIKRADLTLPSKRTTV